MLYNRKNRDLFIIQYHHGLSLIIDHRDCMGGGKLKCYEYCDPKTTAMLEINEMVESFFGHALLVSCHYNGLEWT